MCTRVQVHKKGRDFRASRSIFTEGNEHHMWVDGPDSGPLEKHHALLGLLSSDK